MPLLTQYRLDAIDRHLETIHPEMRTYFPDSFPKAPSRWLSRYRFESPTLRIEDDGFVHGDYTRQLAHLFDFGWIRQAVAPYYGSRGGHCYDPASLLFVEIAGYLDGCRDVKSIANHLRDASKGAAMRRYAGLSGKHLPDGDDFTNLHQRLGEEGYLTILQGFVEIASRLELLTPPRNSCYLLLSRRKQAKPPHFLFNRFRIFISEAIKATYGTLNELKL